MYILRYFCHKKYFKHFTFWRRITGYLVSKKILRHFFSFILFKIFDIYIYIYCIYFDIEKISFLSKIHIFVLITGCFQRIHTVSWNHYSQHSKPNSHILVHFSKSVIVYCKMQVPPSPAFESWWSFERIFRSGLVVNGVETTWHGGHLHVRESDERLRLLLFTW